MVCAECMKMCCLGGKNSVVKGLRVHPTLASVAVHIGTNTVPVSVTIPVGFKTDGVQSYTRFTYMTLIIHQRTMGLSSRKRSPVLV